MKDYFVIVASVNDYNKRFYSQEIYSEKFDHYPSESQIEKMLSELKERDDITVLYAKVEKRYFLEE